MEDHIPDSALATREEAIEEKTIGRISLDEKGVQILNGAGGDIEPDSNWRIFWKAHETLTLEIMFDEKDILADANGDDVKMPIKILGGTLQPKPYFVKSHDPNASYYYDAKLLANNRRRHRPLSGKQASAEEERAYAETYTATRPRIVVGTGGDSLTDDGDSPSDP